MPGECPKSPVWRRRASLVWLGQTALLAPCPTSDFGHSHVRSVCKQTLVFFAETRDNPLARMPRHIVPAAFAHLSNSGHSRRSSRHPPIIADPRQAFTNLKIVKYGPSGAPRSAPAFREPARRSDAARQACEQEARRR
nr:hypothetical protein [Burkholderia ubonensis]